MMYFNKIVVLFVMLIFGCTIHAQKGPTIKPYTIETTYEKLKKDYPFIKPIEELRSEKIVSKENVVYRNLEGRELKADVYFPKNDNSKIYPAVLLIHGGGWVSGNKENQRVMAQHLAENGFVAVTAAYRLSREAPYPAAVLDLKEAIRWIRKNDENYPLDPDKIAVLGASAGAQLATLVGVTPNHQNYTEASKTGISEEVQAIVNIDGIVSFVHPEAEESEIAGLWLGGLQSENPTNWKEASPLEYVDENTPPTLFINSSQPRFHAGRDDMLAILDKHGIYHETHTIADSPHSFWLMHPWFEETLEYTVEFLNKTLKYQQQEKISWRQAQRQEEEWYDSEEAKKIADNLLLYQNENGGWLKNIDMADELTDDEKLRLKKEKSRKKGTTIDNKATHTQMRYLAKVYNATGVPKYKKAFLKGVDYLLEAQYENGGWPQFYPIRKGYYEHITYNDGAMIGVMSLLRDIAENKKPYEFVDTQRRKAAKKAIDKGLEIILKTQIEVDGELTAWCAQHDRKTLLPAKARAYELPSVSGGESVGIVRYLMEIEDPEPDVVKAVESAVKWFENVKITGKEVKRIKDESKPEGRDVIVVEDPEAEPLWARFYEIGTNRPMFVGRDGVVKEKLSDIENERRVGYAYLVATPRDLLQKDYPAWKAKHHEKL